MASIKDRVEQLNQMILSGDILGAFEQFYGEEVVMQDNNLPERVGKSTCREFEKDFVNSLTAFRGAKVRNVMVSEDAGVSMVEWDFDYTHKDWGDRNYTQVAVQEWKDGQIVRERFVYQN